MKEKIKAALKTIMKADLYDENEKPIIVNLKNLKDENALMEAFIKATDDIYYRKEEDEFVIIDDNQLQDLLGEEVVELYGNVIALLPPEPHETKIVIENEEEEVPSVKDPQPSAPKKEKKEKVKKEKKEKPQVKLVKAPKKSIDPFVHPSAVTKAVMVLCEEGPLSTNDLTTKLNKMGYKITASTARIQRGVCLKTIAYLKSLGKLKK